MHKYYGEFQSSIKIDWYTCNSTSTVINSWPILFQLSSLCSHIIILNCICFILAVLGLRHCTGFSLVVASRSYSLAAVLGLLIAWAALFWSMSSGAHRLSSWGSQALQHRLNSCGTRVAGRIFLDHGLNPCLLHWADSLPLSH